MSYNTYAVTGLPRPANAKSKTVNIPFVPNLPVRYEITCLANSTNECLQRQWTLFVLGLEAFKKKPVDEKLSYFQVAGIHGFPAQPWDHSSPKKDDFFCTHGTLNFSTWHRPYILLFERCVWENMNVIIDTWAKTLKKEGKTFKDREIWQKAADEWRMPYWDWARIQAYKKNFAYPKVVTVETVPIHPPAEVAHFYPSAANYPNPLWSFENPEKGTDGKPLPFGSMPLGKEGWNIEKHFVGKKGKPEDQDDPTKTYPWDRCTSTSRYGVRYQNSEYVGLDGVNDFATANSEIGNKKIEIGDVDPVKKWNLADCVNRMFVPGYNKSWDDFATAFHANGKEDRNIGHMSLEHIHNNMHNATGGAGFAKGLGHMSDVPVAAFDPIFWLHHCQIDRLLAIWQCLNPEIWFNGPNEAAVESLPLQPFHTKNNGNPWLDVYTSKECKDWTEFNYQYDDLQGLTDKTTDANGNLMEEEYQKKLLGHINEIYPSTANVVNQVRKEADPTTHDLLKSVNNGIGDKAWNDYIVNVVYDRYALQGQSYTIKFYLGGPFGKSQTQWDEENYVGMIYNFAGYPINEEGGCANCKAQAKEGALSSGQVPLTIQLVEHAKSDNPDHPIRNLTPEEIEGYLKLHLGWQYIGPSGAIVDSTEFPKTIVTVLKGTGKLQPAQPVPELPPPEALQVDASAGAGVLETQTFGIQAEMTEPAKVVPALYSGYTVLAKATDGETTLDGSAFETA